MGELRTVGLVEPAQQVLGGDVASDSPPLGAILCPPSPLRRHFGRTVATRGAISRPPSLLRIASELRTPRGGGGGGGDGGGGGGGGGGGNIDGGGVDGRGVDSGCETGRRRRAC